MTNDIFPAELVIKSLRDSGYKNAAYALAELVDNSVQAGSKKIEVYLCERTPVKGRKVLENILVIDNGSGMDDEQLVKSLRFGDGTRLKQNQWDGIGKFGMGLPSASISQCSKVDVWSRKKGADSVRHTYLDIEEVRSGELKSIPKPKEKALPAFMPKSELLNKQGTIVMWSNLDKCTWKTAKALHTNSAFLLGRIYRYFINSKEVDISFVYWDLDEKKETARHSLVKNDPLYLMSNTQCSEPYHDKALFEVWAGDRGKKEYEVQIGDQNSVVTVTYTIAKKEARDLPDGKDAGSTGYGKDTKKNVGVSIVRAKRELELDLSFVSGYDPKERWWGVEVSFEPILDEVFGVTNNKQHARHFSEMTNHRMVDLIDQFDSVSKVEEELKKNGDPSWVLFRVCHDISNTLTQIRNEIKTQTKGRRSLENKSSATSADVAEQNLTSGTKDRVDNGKKGKTDNQNTLSVAEKTKAVVDVLTGLSMDHDLAKQLAENIISSGTRYNFEEVPMHGAMFFDVRQGGSVNIISVNINHPFYNLLYKQIAANDLDIETLKEDGLRERLKLSAMALKILLGSWARLEDEAGENSRTQLQDFRYQWGMIARDFLKDVAE